VNVREVSRDLLCALDGLPVAGVAEGSAAKSTAHSYFHAGGDWDGTLERIHHALYVETRERKDAKRAPTAAIIDSQSAKGVKKGSALDRKGLDAGKKAPGASAISCRYVGLLLNVVSIPPTFRTARGAAGFSIGRTRCLFPFIERISPMPAIRDHAPRERLQHRFVGCSEIVKRTNCTIRRLPSVDRRTHPGMDQRNRRLARDFERSPGPLLLRQAGMIRIMLRR